MVNLYNIEIMGFTSVNSAHCTRLSKEDINQTILNFLFEYYKILKL